MSRDQVQEPDAALDVRQPDASAYWEAKAARERFASYVVIICGLLLLAGLIAATGAGR